MIGRVFGAAGAAIGAVVLLLIVTFFVAKHYRVPSSAMEPTLHCARPQTGCEGAHQDRFIVFTFLHYGRGDIVTFHAPPQAVTRCGTGGVFVKRIIGVPGDTLSIRRGFVYVNGRKLDEPYVERGRRDFQSHAPVHIGEARYFLMGDNRAASCDSRVWGTVAKGEIIGKAFAIYWPLGRVRFL